MFVEIIRKRKRTDKTRGTKTIMLDFIIEKEKFSTGTLRKFKVGKILLCFVKKDSIILSVELIFGFQISIQKITCILNSLQFLLF